MRLRSSVFVFFQAEDGIRDLVRSRGLGDVYKRQVDGKVVIPLVDGIADDLCFDDLIRFEQTAV